MELNGNTQHSSSSVDLTHGENTSFEDSLFKMQK